MLHDIPSKKDIWWLLRLLMYWLVRTSFALWEGNVVSALNSRYLKLTPHNRLFLDVLSICARSNTVICASSPPIPSLKY